MGQMQPYPESLKLMSRAHRNNTKIRLKVPGRFSYQNVRWMMVHHSRDGRAQLGDQLQCSTSQLTLTATRMKPGKAWSLPAPVLTGW